GPLAGLLPREYETRRGFVGWASFSALEFTHKAGAICDLTPLEEVFIGPCGRRGMEVLCACPALARVGRVTFYDTTIRSDGLAMLAASPHLAGVRALGVEGNGVGFRGARALARSPHVAGLRELNLNSNQIGDPGARALAAGNWQELRSLDLGNNALTDASASALARSERLSTLTSLQLSSSEMTAAGAGELAQAPLAPGLTELAMYYSPTLGNHGARALAGSPERPSRLTSLRDLNVHSCRIGVSGLAALGDSPAL